ncbi:MAG TPA: sialate O-acetylesterase [Planctomycetaceae bacterium]|nr:sialate O-acetylesterase [Planctomycetaceae bacterium]
MQMALWRTTRIWGLMGLAAAAMAAQARADVKLPNVFGDHMVLQQGQKNKVWGLAEAGEAVTVTIDKQRHQVKAGSDGKWQVMLDALKAGGPYSLTIQGRNKVSFDDVLVGEVWVCSGQSNMWWQVRLSNDPDLERLAAKFPKLRMINFPNIGSQQPIWTHDVKWMVCSPETVLDFSAVGYFFGRQLLETLDVPIGLINNAWGGSACEAWIRRDLLAADPEYKPLMDRWAQLESQYADLSKKKDLNDDQKKQLDALRNPMNGNSRPGNIYNGVLVSHLGYGIKGAIWYQGESNAGRAYQYRDLFPLMIKNWRDDWGQGNFPFYWVQLADFLPEKAEPSDSAWAELREAQTMTMSKLPNTGEAVIIDIGEGKDIHPKNKVDVGRRLARWALAKDYGLNIPYHSPQYKAMEKQGNKIVLTFDFVDGGWRPFDVNDPRGFTIAGEDKKFVAAKAKILQDMRIEVTAEQIENPAAVRYGWADNPVVNMFNQAGLPLTPFRTDDWPGTTINAK